jgi:GNAT superfamily N-acetyltransferase
MRPPQDAPTRPVNDPHFHVEVGGDLPGPELAQALALLEIVYPGKFDERSWRWKYSNHYLGPPKIAVARHQGRIIGLQPSIRHDIWWDGRRRTAYQLTDVLTHPEHRRRGVFSSMVEAFTASAAAERAACVFTFPNRRSFPAFQRLGTWRHPVSLPLLVRLNLPRFRRRNDRTVEIQELARFDSSVDELGSVLPRSFNAASVRDHRYLNWRYQQHPDRPYICLAAKNGGRWRAFAVGRIGHRLGVRVGLIVDFLGEPALLTETIRELESRLLRRGAVVLGAVLTSGSRTDVLLRSMGYRSLPPWAAGKEFYFLATSAEEMPEGLGSAAGWWLTWANSDIV